MKIRNPKNEMLKENQKVKVKTQTDKAKFKEKFKCQVYKFALDRGQKGSIFAF
jgi:hypothetical protein